VEPHEAQDWEAEQKMAFAPWAVKEGAEGERKLQSALSAEEVEAKGERKLQSALSAEEVEAKGEAEPLPVADCHTQPDAWTESHTPLVYL
jgi:hypothetical protein